MNKELWQRIRRVVLWTVGVLSLWWVPTLLWWLSEPFPIRVHIVDYTVPFDNYTEHTGLMWLLDHLKIPAPEPDRLWDPTKDYTGYDPLDREHPKRLKDADLAGVEWLYFVDTYGVYIDDLKNIPAREAHMDFNQPVFGGLDADDVEVIAQHSARGGHVMMEFNSFCEPTDDAVRERVEDFMGVEWTGWSGHFFKDLYNVAEVPHWVPRLFAQQYPGQEMPHTPTLLFINNHGRIAWVTHWDPEKVKPRIQQTGEGAARFGPIDPVPYYNWFSVMRPVRGTRHYAEMHLPDFEEAQQVFRRWDIPLVGPFLSERVVAGSRRIYYSGDFSEVDFDPGWFWMWGISDIQAWIHEGTEQISARAPFWGFFIPTLKVFWGFDVPKHLRDQGQAPNREPEPWEWSYW